MTDLRSLATILLLTVALAPAASADLPPSLAQYKSEQARRLVPMLPGQPIAMPASYYDFDELKTSWANLKANPELQAEVAPIRARADRWAAIPAERWTELIPDRSPAPICNYPKKGASGYLKADPLTGARAGHGWFGEIDLIEAPFKIESSFDDVWLYEREEDIPDDYPYPVKGHDTYPHWDGRPRRLYYIESKAHEFDGEPMRIYPENVVWNARMDAIVGMWGGGVLPDLTEAYLATGDDRYARTIVTILDRLARVFPNYPLAYYNGVDEQTREDLVRKAARHEPVGWHGWLGPARLHAAATNFRPPGEGYRAWNIAKAFMAVERSSAWGEDDQAAAAAKARVRKRLLEEMALLFHSYGAYNCVGNGIGMYAPGLLGLGIANRDAYLFNGYCGILEEFLYNDNYYDGLSTEGSNNYAGMVGGMYNRWRDRLRYDPGVETRHPFVLMCGRTQQRTSSQWGAMSQHGDGPNGAFTISRDGPPRDADGKPVRKPSVAFGGYGIGILRGGAPERRLEVFLHHDRVVGHGHPDTLGVQVHYRGIPIVNFLGDSRWGRFVDLHEDKNPAAAMIKQLPYPREMVVEEPGDHEGWAYRLSHSPLTKNRLIVDEYVPNHGRAPWRGGFADPKKPYGNLRLFKGATDPAGEAAAFQAIEATAENMIPLHYYDLRDYRRTLIMIERPDGRPYVVDVFHAAGGNRHLMLWHSQGEVVESGMPAGAQTFDTLRSFLDNRFENRTEWTAPMVQLTQLDKLTDVRVKRRAPGTWRHTWRLDYALWAPKRAPEGQEPLSVDEWHARGVRPIRLRLHGVAMPRRPASHLVEATSVYPAMIELHVEGQRPKGMVRFKDGLNYIGMLDASKQHQHSTFVHVLEPYGDDEAPAIRSIETLPVRAGTHRYPPGVVGLEIAFADGTRDRVALLPPAVGEYDFGERMTVRGRAALARFNADGAMTECRLVSGTRLVVDGAERIAADAADLRGQVVRLEGDLSGDRSTSAVVLRPDRPWPEGKALAGRMLTVTYNRGRRFENYPIDRVEPLEDGTQRVVLEGAPPFVDLWGEVQSLEVTDRPRNVVRPNEFMGKTSHKGSLATGYLKGSRIAFPTLGVELTFDGGETKTWRYDIAEAVDLKELGVTEGTPYAIYPDTRGSTATVAGERGVRRTAEGFWEPVGE